MSIHTYATLEVARQHQSDIAKQYKACQARSATTRPGRPSTKVRLSLRVASGCVAVLASVVTLVLVAAPTPAHAATASAASAATDSGSRVVAHLNHPNGVRNWV